MQKKIIALLLAAVTFVCCGCSMGNSKVRIGTAGLGGIYNEFGNALVQLSAEDNSLNFEVKNTTGSAANLRLLSQGYIDMAIAQADLVNDAYFGTGTFKESGQYRGYSAVAALYTEACQIVVRADSNIKTVDNLLGKNVSIGEDESGTEQNAKQILAAYGLSESMVKEKNLNYTDAASQLTNGKIDAMFCTSGANTTVIEELSKQCDIRLIDISDDAKVKLKSAYKFYTDYTIPANTYKGQSKEVKTLGVKSVLLASDKLSADTVNKTAQLIFNNADKLQYTLTAPLQLDEKTAVNGITIPFHKGAQEYYNSKNISINIAE